MMQNNLRKKVRKANENLRKLYDWMDEVNLIEKMTTSTNLKLYDCCGYCGDETFSDEMKEWLEKEYPTMFDLFCEDSFRCLDEYCNEEYNNNFYDMVSYIGRTSSFYMGTDLAGIKPERYNIFKWLLSGCELSFDRMYYNDYDCDFDIIDEDSNLITSETIKKFYYDNDYDFLEVIDLIDIISNSNLVEEVKKDYIDYIELFDYIQEFKENQIEIYNEYLKGSYEFYNEVA